MQRAFFASLIALAMPGLTHAGSLDLASVLTPQLQIVAPLRVDLPIATNNPAIGTITATPITPVTGSTTATPIYTVVEGPSLSGSGSISSGTISSGTISSGTINSGTISSGGLIYGSLAVGSTLSSSMTMRASGYVALEQGSIMVAYGSTDATAGAVTLYANSSHGSVVEMSAPAAIVLTASPLIATPSSLVLVSEVPLGDSALYFAGTLLPLVMRLLAKRKACNR